MKRLLRIHSIALFPKCNQCTEGFLAISDKKSNQLVMNEEFFDHEKEWIDEQHLFPLITDLLRTTQPIIRYRFG